MCQHLPALCYHLRIEGLCTCRVVVTMKMPHSATASIFSNGMYTVGPEMLCKMHFSL